MSPLVVAPLTAAAFAPFGAVIEAREASAYAINGGTTRRFHRLAVVELSGPDDTAQLSLFRGQPFALPVQVRGLERHPRGSQAFMPLSGRPYLVVVAPPAADLDEGSVRAFLASGEQGVQYATGTWHHPLLALGAVSDFLVVDRDGPGDNCDEVTLRTPRVIVEIPA